MVLVFIERKRLPTRQPNVDLAMRVTVRAAQEHHPPLAHEQNSACRGEQKEARADSACLGANISADVCTILGTA